MKMDKKEKKKAYMKVYRQTPIGKKLNRIQHWKQRGLHVDDYNQLYKKYLETTHCEKCGVEFVDGKRNRNSKVTDHCHKTKTNNFRAFVCHACNCNDKTTNKSGTPNVFYDKKSGSWRYSKTVNKKNHTKYFKTKDEAIDYKKDYESSL